jgi:hypothetical protein
MMRGQSLGSVPVQSPDQFLKLQPEAGMAVRLIGNSNPDTSLPIELSKHVPVKPELVRVQSMPATSLTTLPSPPVGNAGIETVSELCAAASPGADSAATATPRATAERTRLKPHPPKKTPFTPKNSSSVVTDSTKKLKSA